MTQRFTENEYIIPSPGFGEEIRNWVAYKFARS